MVTRTFVLSKSFGIFRVMRNIFLIAILSLFLFGCSETKPKIAETPIENTPETNQQQKPETVTAHTTDKEKDAESASSTNDDPEAKDDPSIENTGKKTKWSRSGTPIDVSNQTQMIAEAEKKLKANPDDANLKRNLAQAYAKRGVTLTSAQQYASAIGDFRKTLKYDENNQLAKTWVEQITGIYKSMKREAPKEGEEPEPLEFKKGKA